MWRQCCATTRAGIKRLHNQNTLRRLPRSKLPRNIGDSSWHEHFFLLPWHDEMLSISSSTSANIWVLHSFPSRYRSIGSGTQTHTFMICLQFCRTVRLDSHSHTGKSNVCHFRPPLLRRLLFGLTAEVYMWNDSNHIDVVKWHSPLLIQLPTQFLNRRAQASAAVMADEWPAKRLKQTTLVKDTWKTLRPKTYLRGKGWELCKGDLAVFGSSELGINASQMSSPSHRIINYRRTENQPVTCQQIDSKTVLAL